MSFFEAAMLICFGVSWPVAVWKTLTTRQVQGKSCVFIALVASGYGFGVIHKALHSFDWLIFLYGFNFLIVLTELGLCLMYGSRQRCELMNANAAADTLFKYYGDNEVRIQENVAQPAPIPDGTDRSYINDDLLATPIVLHLPAVAKARIGNRNNSDHLQQRFRFDGVSDQTHSTERNCATDAEGEYPRHTMASP